MSSFAVGSANKLSAALFETPIVPVTAGSTTYSYTFLESYASDPNVQLNLIASGPVGAGTTLASTCQFVRDANGKAIGVTGSVMQANSVTVVGISVLSLQSNISYGVSVHLMIVGS